VTEFCKGYSELTGYIKFWEFLHYLRKEYLTKNEFAAWSLLVSWLDV